MEQLQQLLDLLKQTPEMALYAAGIYFLFILAKMASWIYALTITARLFINRYFDHHESARQQNAFKRILDESLFCEPEYLLKLLSSLNDGGSVFKSDVDRAIKLIKEGQKKE